MLDRYWHGAVERISPEAPVPVVKVSREEERIGRPPTSPYNVSTLGAQASFLGVVGDDEPGHRLEALLKETGIQAPPQARPGPAHHRQAARDRPAAAAAAHGFRERAGPRGAGPAERGLHRLLGKQDAILFSDYGKGGWRTSRP
jgi:bifunctional ADP-heptose synthase (sugar kinase/adenylyltransferase)